MRTVDDLELSYTRVEQPELGSRPGLLNKLEHRKLIFIIIAVAVAFCARVYRLDAAGLAEDESNKIFAVRAYEQGDFTANAEHPMLMKALCFASMHVAETWNESAGDRLGFNMSEETALRLPNALFGALTVVPLFLLANALLGFRVAAISALLWAFGLNAVWINRVVKEDTLMVFFMLSAFYFYHCAKQRPASDEKGQERLYAVAGIAFGLMLASKYFPHYLGLNALFYNLVGYDSRNNRPPTRRMWLKFFGAMLLAFVVFNPALFVPHTWRYIWMYVNEDLITHHGYLVMNRLYDNDMGATPGGTPWYFYYLFLAIKLPIPTLISFLVGAVEIFRRRGEPSVARGYLFLRMMLFFWLFPMALVGAKFLRYTLSLMALIYIVSAIGIVVMWRWLSTALKRLSFEARLARTAAAVAVGVAFLIAPAEITRRNMPYPSLYLNSFGGSRVGYFFPHDEFYDLGARESIKFIADTAPRGAVVASEIPGVVQYYLERYDRPDIRSAIISHPKFSLAASRPDYVLLQRGRVYFENLENFKLVESSFSILQASEFEGAAATQVYANERAALRVRRSEPEPAPSALPFVRIH